MYQNIAPDQGTRLKAAFASAMCSIATITLAVSLLSFQPVAA